jgi:hypothetical protein
MRFDVQQCRLKPLHVPIHLSELVWAYPLVSRKMDRNKGIKEPTGG